MGSTVALNSADGHALGAYRAWPDDMPKGAVLVVQEIFGVNDHIRDVCDRFAAAGYAAMAPSLFDRLRPGIELDCDDPGIERGRAVRRLMAWRDALVDMAATEDMLRLAGKVGVVGFCWGGSLAWLAASRLPVDAAVGSYGGHIADYAYEPPHCPAQLHFGGRDAAIPEHKVDAIRSERPEVPLHVYPEAGHGFHCDRRDSYHPESAALAWDRTLAFLSDTLS